MYWSRSAIGFSIWSDDLQKLQEVGSEWESLPCALQTIYEVVSIDRCTWQTRLEVIYCGGLPENRMKDAIMLVTRQAFASKIVCTCTYISFGLDPYMCAYKPRMQGCSVVGKEPFHRSCCRGVWIIQAYFERSCHLGRGWHLWENVGKCHFHWLLKYMCEAQLLGGHAIRSMCLYGALGILGVLKPYHIAAKSIKTKKEDF